MGKKILYLILFVFLTSCDTNVFYIDKENQCIVGKDKPLKHISIFNENERFLIFWNRKKAKAPLNRLCLNNIPNYYYLISDNRENNKVTVQLKPNTKYIIEVSGGDAGTFSLSIETDRYGKIK